MCSKHHLPLWLAALQQVLVVSLERVLQEWRLKICFFSSGVYRVLARLFTHTSVLADVAAENEMSVGVMLAVKLCLPVTGGFHEQVAEKFG